MAGLLLALPLVLAAGGINPYAPLPGWSYALEAAGRLPWPSCPDRYVGAGNDAGCGSGIVLGDTMATWEMIAAPEHGLANETFYVKLACGRFLSCKGPRHIRTGTNPNTVLASVPGALLILGI